ncbi:hypothetical protein KDH_71440 [Dictyobacter sp. S3.2.2.5]|uniref:histidine kinase n=1 Tax=Dictyobacter halimunensis TaxID=3026934 RepID=A0ABQ6G2U9_9CHLR|nr:hypothetical protein KDH_71440 [Dictyobacter sp. S3.2.2.5]
MDAKLRYPLKQQDSARLRALIREIFDVFGVLSTAGEMQSTISRWPTVSERQYYQDRGWLAAIHPLDHPLVDEAFTESVANGQPRELTCRLLQGAHAYALTRLHFIPVRDTTGALDEILVCGQQEAARDMGEAEVQLALQASGVGTWNWNLLTGELVWNDQKRALFGLAPGTPVSYEVFLKLLHPDDRELTHRINTQALAGKREYKKDYRVVWPDGSVHWLADQARVSRNEAGEPIQVIGATVDVTERKQREAQIQQASDQVNTILESITDAFLSLDAQWHYRYVNRRLAALHGKTQEELLGKCMWDVVPALLGTPFEDHCRAAMQNRQTMHFEGFHPVFKIWVEAHIYPQPEGLAIYLHDISERKQVEEALRESEARFQRLRESNIIGMITTDEQGNVLDANDAFLALLGYTRAELETEQITWSAITSEQTQQRDSEAIEEALQTGAARPYEKEYLGKDGRRIPVLIGRALFRREGAAPQFLCFVLDQTARKEAERQKDIFLGITGHELRTPLAALKGTLQLINRRLKRFIRRTDQVTPEVAALLADTHESLLEGVRQVDIQTRLVNDLLDISRITTGTLTLSLRRCNLVPIVREAVEDLRIIAPDRQLLFEVAEDNPIPVMVDPTRIQQVTTNYLTNALRYSRAEQPVTTGIYVRNHMAHVWVRDQGPGLSPEAREKIWQCFHQVKEVPVQSGTEKGLGLGLYLCKILIEQHHGTVDVESTPGKGSTFWFHLPLDTE